MKDKEIEIRFPLKNPQKLIEELNSKAQLIDKDIFQKDTYYVPAHRNFLDNDWPYEWLRLRETANGASINYKHYHRESPDKAADFCDEFQTKIENIDAIKKIFENLNFRDAIIVEKLRSTWGFKNVEIAIDNIKGLGFYVEIESKREFTDPKVEKQHLFNILFELNAEVGQEDVHGYAFALLKKQKSDTKN